MPKHITDDILDYFDTKVDAREDEKFSGLKVRNRNDILSEYFKSHRDGLIYGVKFPYDSNGVLQATAGVKYGANTGLVMEPSTYTVIGRDDYSSINLFKHFEANVHLDEVGNLVVDYLQGEAGFSYYGKVDVVCIFASVYEKVYEDYEEVGGISTKYKYIEWTDTPREGYTLNVLCRNSGGKDRGFYVIPKFVCGLIYGVKYCSAGLYPWVYGQTASVVNKAGTTVSKNGPCYNNCVDIFHAMNDWQSAMTMSQYCMIQRIFMMKYGHTDYQLKLGGCSAYNNTLTTLADITAQPMVVMSTTDSVKIVKYSTLSLDDGGTQGNARVLDINNDNVVFTEFNTNLTMETGYSVTSSIGTLIIDKPTTSGDAIVDLNGDSIPITVEYNDEEITVHMVAYIDSGNYSIKILDSNNNVIGASDVGVSSYSVAITDDDLTTTLNGSIYTRHWKSGYSIKLLGTDGAPIEGSFSNTTKHASVISGIEMFVGAHEILGNVVCEYDAENKVHIKVCNALEVLSNTTATIDANYIDIGYYTTTVSSTSWAYLKDIKYDLANGGCYGDAGGTGTGSTTGICDGYYALVPKTSGKTEIVMFGALIGGALCGPFCSTSHNALSLTIWYLACRPSFVGNSLVN